MRHGIKRLPKIHIGDVSGFSFIKIFHPVFDGDKKLSRSVSAWYKTKLMTRKKIVRDKVFRELIFDNFFKDFADNRGEADWAVIRRVLFVAFLFINGSNLSFLPVIRDLAGFHRHVKE